MKKNDIIRLEITAMSSEGSGIGRYGGDTGLAVFVPFTAIGDVIECLVVKTAKTHAFGIIREIISPSEHRLAAPPDCSVFGKCGGCAFRHMEYQAELDCKHRRVTDALQRIGGINAEVMGIVGCPEPDRYRNKAQIPVTPGPDGPVTGFYAPRSHRVTANGSCMLQPGIFGDITELVAQWMRQTGAAAYDEHTKTGLIRHIFIRMGQATGEIMVCLVCTSGRLPGAELLTDTLRRDVPGLVSIMVNINAENTNVVLGRREFVLWGRDTITDILCGVKFRLSPRSFFQVNSAQAERLYGIAAQAAELTGKELLLDMYCGTGAIGLSMANMAGRIIGVDSVQSAITDARFNAEQNGIQNAQFICADAAQAAVMLAAEGLRPDAVVLDPPRKGCAPELIGTVCGMSPERIVYISCNPATLARDLALMEQSGYVTRHVTPVDMFPRTPHVETIALLQRRDR